jgi:hypothetical protein
VRSNHRSPAAHRPITYHVVSSPVAVVARASTWTHDLAGVRALQDAISSVAPNRAGTLGDTHAAYSYRRPA